MLKFIKFETSEDESIWINPTHVIAVQFSEDDGYSAVHLVNDRFEILGEPEDIVRRLQDIK